MTDTDYKPPEKKRELVIVTGLSGAGKSTALRCLDDQGYFCLDNLPPPLIKAFIDLYETRDQAVQGLAVCCDIRAGQHLSSLRENIDELRKLGFEVKVIFLDCSEEILIRRYQTERRTHPLAQLGFTLEKALELEYDRFKVIRDLATVTIDTTSLKPSQLRDRILSYLAGSDSLSVLSFTVMSFGYKYGAPIDCDYIFDVRFLPNPFYIEQLRSKTGLDQDVYDFVFADPKAKEFTKTVFELLSLTMDGFTKLHKYRITVGIGCTGGKHRSVAVASALKELLKHAGHSTLIVNRDIDKD